jgi:broad-specificity NMP kinase
MEKSIIIIGSASTGKSTVAKALASHIAKDSEITLIRDFDFYQSDPFRFNVCTKQTKLVIIDELRKKQNLDGLIQYHESIDVNQPYKESFVISPKLIVVCDEGITSDDLPKGQSFRRRFQIIECK